MPPRPADAPRPPLPTWLVCALLAAGTFLLYTRSLDYGFINYDDPAYLTENSRVQAGPTWDGVVWAFTGRTDYWHPLTWVSHMLDWRLFGADATGHRAVNIAWHAVNAALAFLLCRRLTGTWGLALFSAALFAWHPLRVESVVWVTERKDVMSGFFFLLSLLAYARYADLLKSGRPAGRAYTLTLALFLGGLMCKPSLVPLPLLLWALDFWPLGRLSLRPAPGWWAAHRCVVLEKLPFLLLSAAVSVATILMQAAHNAFVLAVPFSDRLGNALVSVARYLAHTVWPARLAIFYEHPGAWPLLPVLGATVLVLAVTVLAWRSRDRAPWLLAGWVWFVVMLLPALGLLQVGRQAMADRFTYLPILGLQLALLSAVAVRWPSPRLQAVGAAVLLSACAGATWWQQGFWRDSATLYRRALAVNPASPNAAAFLAYTLQEPGGDLAESEQLARRALTLDPDNHWGLLALATVLGQTGRPAEAAEKFQRMTELNPAYARGHYLRSLLLLQLGRVAEAETGLARAAELLPASAQTRLVLAEVRARQRKFEAAAAAYREVIALQPASAEAHAGLGYMLALTGRREEAAQHWEEALRLNPAFPGLRERLERLRREAGPK